MAKRTTRSQADDTSTMPAQAPKARRARANRPLGPESVTGLKEAPEMAETFAAREPGAATTMGDADADQAAISMSSSPSDEDIRLRAYQIYLERGGTHGLDQDDWIRAERELRTRGR